MHSSLNKQFPPSKPGRTSVRSVTSFGVVMKARIFIILVFLLCLTNVFGQTDNTLYVRQFPGSTVAAKLTVAMNACNPSTVIPCILVLDPSLAAFPSGSMPSLCAQCSLADYRTGFPFANSAITANVATFAGASADVKLNACIASFSTFGLCDARGFGATTQVMASTVSVPAGITILFDPSTQFVPASASAGALILAAGSKIQGLTVNVSTYATTYSGKAVSLPCVNGGANASTTISGLSVIGASMTAGAPGTALALTCSVAFGGVAFVNVDNFLSAGLLHPLLLNASAASSWINSNHFRNFTLIGPNGAAFTAIDLNNTGLEIRGNTFLGFSIEGNGFSGAVGIAMEANGTSPIQANEFEGEIFDASSPWVLSGTALNNFFMGNSDTAMPADTLNHYFDLLHDNLQYKGSLALVGSNPRFFAGTPVSSGQQAGMVLQAAGVTKWSLLQNTDNSFFIQDAVHGVNPFNVDTSGNTTVGETGTNTQVQGNVSVHSGANVLLRCTTAGALPIGALTINAASCGASSDTGLRVN